MTKLSIHTFTTIEVSIEDFRSQCQCLMPTTPKYPIGTLVHRLVNSVKIPSYVAGVSYRTGGWFYELIQHDMNTMAMVKMQLPFPEKDLELIEETE